MARVQNGHADPERAGSARVGCAVLAAGRSRRLGRPKQLVTLDGLPLVRRIAQVVLAADFAGCAVIVGCRAVEVMAALTRLPLTLLPNPEWKEGIASSIRVAARWADEEQLTGLALVTCDQWRLSRSHLVQLCAAVTEPHQLAGSQYGEVVGIPAAFGRAWFTQLMALSGESGAGVLLSSSSRVHRVPWTLGMDDLDTEADLVRARAHFAAGD